MCVVFYANTLHAQTWFVWLSSSDIEQAIVRNHSSAMCTPTDTPFNKNRSFVAQTPSMHNAFSVGEVSERALVGEHRVDRRGRNSGHHARKLGIDLLCGHLVLHSGPIRRRDLLAIELVPVDVLEPGMVLDLVRGVVPQPLRRLLLQQPRDQIVRLRVTPPLRQPTSGDMNWLLGTEAVRMRWYIILRLES